MYKKELLDLLKAYLRVELSTAHEYGDGDTIYARIKLIFDGEEISESYAPVGDRHRYRD